ncbi:AFP2 [Abeliophyllum distichum]|uniref:Ninja-family protein n=1 Tax=Abeliophyllum distichum TaxID=126358 RepID=A0ABD1V7D4_9LAMI
MVDDNALDLTLGLPCGGGGSSVKGKIGSSSDTRSNEVDRGSKVIDKFKNFLEDGAQQHPVKTEENIFNNFPKAAVDVETSKNMNTGGLWVTNDCRSTSVEEEKRSDVSEKRKSLFSEMSQQKKRETETHHPDFGDKTKGSHISISTDEGSTAENEGVADSEVEGSSLRQVSQHDDSSRRFVDSCDNSRVHKEVHAFSDSSGVELLGQNRFTISSEKEFNTGNMSTHYRVPFPAQTVNMLNVPFSQPVNDYNPSSTPSSSSYPLPGMMHVMGGTNSEQPGVMVLFLIIISFAPLYTGRDQINMDKGNDGPKITQATMPVILHKSSDANDGKEVDRTRSNRKQHVGEEGSSTHTEGDLKGIDFPAIRPGIAADLKFGGCGSCPNLPWVSTTGSGPNGKTISGVTYKYSPTQIRIVCACHGSHMSPEEFVQHASEENPESGTGLPSFPSSAPVV